MLASGFRRKCHPGNLAEFGTLTAKWKATSEIDSSMSALVNQTDEAVLLFPHERFLMKKSTILTKNQC